MESKIKVGVRIRPLNAKELDANSLPVVNSDSGKFVLTKAAAKRQCFEYDWSFNAQSSNRNVYEAACKPLIENIFDGFNATFFAYGQTSSGKTHTLGGADLSEGVIPSALQDIFERRQELLKGGSKVDVEVSYIEIYREECFDLLSADKQKVKLDLKETSGGKTVLDGVTSHAVQSIDEVMAHLREGAKIRSTGQTAMNAHSSRSHSICTLSLRVVRATSGAVTSQLHLVDLAGSERAKKTQATGDAFQEGISINRGLLALGNVVSALAARSVKTGTGGEGASHIHVPYRESKLTRLLKDSLGGNGMTVMLACVSPAEINIEETLNTLRFASRASAIVNSARVNHSVGDYADSAALLKEVLELREQLALLQAARGTVDAGKAVSFANQALVARNNEAALAAAAESHRAAYHFMVGSALRLTVSLKSVLVTCLQEGSYVVDSDLLHIQSELQEVRKGLGLTAISAKPLTAPISEPTIMAEPSAVTTTTSAEGSGEMADLDVEAMLQLPPIMTVLEEVRLLERELRHLEKTCRVGTGESLGQGGGLSGGLPGIPAIPGDEGCDWSEDSMLSGASLELSTCADMLEQPGPGSRGSQGEGRASNANSSFDHSFEGIEGDGDAMLAPQSVSFDEGCSFNEIDAARMDDLLAEFIASQGQGTSSVGRTTGAVSKAAAGAKAAATSSVEDELARQAAQGLLAKEGEMNRVAALTDKYQASIKTLKAEIAAIEGDQARLQARQQQQAKKPLAPATKPFGANGAASSTSSAVSSAEDLRIKQQLKEKTRLLEEKMKLLRQKESEFGKVSTQKARLATEVDGMRRVVEENKRRRAELQRKMKEEAVLHRNEKVQIKAAEVQARRGELQAQQSVVRLEGQLQSREKVWKAQLESKEREAKALKDLVQKQANVKAMKTGAGAGGGAGSGGPSAHTMAAAAALLSQQGSSGLSTQEVLNLKLWVDTELETQVKRATAQEALNREMLLRTKAAQALQTLRRSSHGNADSSMTASAPPADAKALENELRQRSATIAGLNGVLSDLGNASTADKKRFSRFTDLKESRHVSELLFEVAYKAQKRELSATKRAKALQDALARCKQQLREAQSSAEYYQQQATQRRENYIFDDEESDRAEMDETFYPSEEESAYASEGSDSDDSYRGQRRKGRAGGSGAAAGVKKRKAGSADSSVEVESPVAEGGAMVKKVRVQAPAKRGGGGAKQKSAISAEESGADSDSEGDSQDQGHSSSEDSGSDSDSEVRPTKPKKRAVAKAAADTESGAKKTKRQPAAVDPNFDDSEITYPLSKHTISELKRFLAAKGLPVSGVKAELIKRLQAVLPAEATPVADENALPTVVNASAVVTQTEDSKGKESRSMDAAGEGMDMGMGMEPDTEAEAILVQAVDI